MNSIEEVIQFIKSTPQPYYYLLFKEKNKIVWGKKFGCLFFLEGNLFDTIPTFIDKVTFDSSTLKKFLVVDKRDNVTTTTTNTSTTSTTSNTSTNTTSIPYIPINPCNCEDYENILRELVLSVVNIKSTYEIDRNNLKDIVDNFNTQITTIITPN